MRVLIHEAPPDVAETMHWTKSLNRAVLLMCQRAGDGSLGAHDASKGKAKVIFWRGAMLDDSARLFNAGLAGNVQRPISVADGQAVDATAFGARVQAAAAHRAANRRD